jgi:hypothetical protein
MIVDKFFSGAFRNIERAARNKTAEVALNKNNLRIF